MKTLTASLAILFTSLAAPLVAGENPVVVELYTSQGCSSCPPADAMMHKLAKRDDVIGLALHVDYWDYIGWKDEYADPAHTKRQQGYARSGGRTMIYTPQMIVAGQEDVVGAREGELMGLIEAHRAAPDTAMVTATREGDAVSISVAPYEGAAQGTYMVQLVRYTPMKHASIRRGELAGHELDYANVVESWDQVGQWDGAGPVELNAALAGDLPAVVLVQAAGHGPIVAATRVD
ncbi:DUF1223 domain-containing protein [Ruegeria sp. 2205SS24-7]|uniref:DUF1223 domain-containing protein n=1 Tax=Ruegeria discodermiae TaxID=3064389 RepID=UPI0027421D03|nr:DUF1223 domain-containing protein [Ruegeria sp. 2205SS24-7]MDP5215872.1 DUF1223 domain-containing protein [Ruegeria sp. 2205SS24-7]